MYKYILMIFFSVVCENAMAEKGGDQIRLDAALKDCTECPEMVAIPDKEYAVGKYEVTQAEWRSVMGSNPPNLYFTSCGGKCPVEGVSWDEIQFFIQKLNTKTGKQYRLPTEEEWEYACYGGSMTEYCGGNVLSDLAWFDDNSNGQAHPVGQKQANGYGLYDMTGNVWEWTDYCGRGRFWSVDCRKKVLRGGSYNNGAHFQRASYGYGDYMSTHSGYIGFRLSMTLIPALPPGSTATSTTDASVAPPTVVSTPAPRVNKTVVTTTSPTSQKLRELKALKQDGLITEKEYEQKKKQLLEQL
jgi:hypothetical protein